MTNRNSEKSAAPLKYGVSKSLKFDKDVSEKFEDAGGREIKESVPVYNGGHAELLLTLVLKWIKLARTYNMFADADKISKMKQVIARISMEVVRKRNGTS